jgi:hypothetical protein
MPKAPLKKRPKKTVKPVNKFSPHTRVSTIVSGRYDISYSGTVLRADPTDPNLLIIEWDYPKSNITCLDLSNLMLEKDVKQLRSALDKEFENQVSEMKSMVNDAAKLIKVASAMASLHNEKLSDIDSLGDDLFEAMNEAGWRTSFLNC